MKLVRQLSTLLALLLSIITTSAHAVVIDFEDIVNPGCCTFLADGYQGFTWSGSAGPNSWVIADQATSIFPGAQAHSGQNYAWSNGGADLSLSNGMFDFNGMWARGGHEGFSTTATGYLNGVAVYSQDFTVTMDYQLFDFNFTNIDNLTFTDQANNLLIDDMTVNATVPESTTLTLLGLGLLGFGIRKRRQHV